MAMSKKHYTAFAKALSELANDHRKSVQGRVILAYVIRKIADVLEADNKNFDRDTFYAACCKVDYYHDQ